MKISNLHIYRKDPKELARLQEEYRMLGFDTKLEGDHLVVFALKRKKKKKEESDKRKRD